MKHLALIILLLFGANTAFSYVENVSKGYTSCLACHFSPTGGNLLTDYGRALSKEAMSTWGGWEQSEQPLFGLIKEGQSPEWLKLGGDNRVIQTYLNNDSLKSGRLFVMQNNIELGIKLIKDLLFVGTLGRKEGPEGFPERGEFLSERHYLLYSPTQQSRLRMGKFRQRFGLNDPNHTRFVKQSLGFGSLSETYGVEFTNYFGSSELAVSSSLGRIDKKSSERRLDEKNLGLHYVKYLNGNSWLGLSGLFGTSPDEEKRELFSVYGLSSLGKHLLGLFEISYENKEIQQKHRQTLAMQAKLASTALKGFMPYFIFEGLSRERQGNKTSLFESRTLTFSPGVGFQWGIMPHVELQFEYQYRVSGGRDGFSDPSDFAWLQLHLYPF
jgi:hypothetical protein